MRDAGSLAYIRSMRQIGGLIPSLRRFFRNWVKSVGWRAACTWAIYRARMALGFPQPTILKIWPRQAKHPVIARMGESSDIWVFNQIFNCNGYAGLRDIQSPRLILDLGANVGYASAYFLSLFPSATVIAVEPDPGSFELCRQNLAPYGDRARLVLGASWPRRSQLVLLRGNAEDGREWATQVREARDQDEEATVQGWDVPSLLELAAADQIDLLKVDIEGSELQLFEASSASWLPHVRNICIEFHGNDCEQLFLHALRDFEYDLTRSGELSVCRNLRRKALSNGSAMSQTIQRF